MKITDIKQQVKRAGRYSIFVDGKYAFSLSESGLLESGLASGRELNEEELASYKKAAGTDKLMGNALRFAAMRPRSLWEIANYLRRKQADEETSNIILDKLKGLGMADDESFARAWVANRRLLKSISKRKLELELKQKHVPPQIIDTVLKEDQTSEHDTLRDLIAKKRGRYPDAQKLMQYLARQGFGYEDIKTALSDD